MEQQKKRMAALEAVLFAMGEPVSLQVLAKALELNFAAALETVEALKAAYQKEERGIQLIELEGSYQLGTKPEYYENLITVAAAPEKPVLTDTLLETLSIVAYRQPVTKAEINRIRGVSSDHAVSRLIEYGLIQEAGRLNAPGRPMLFATTREFLRRFGMDSLEQLPKQPEKMLEKTTEQVQLDEIQEVQKETFRADEGKNEIDEGLEERKRPSADENTVGANVFSGKDVEDVLDTTEKSSIQEAIEETKPRLADEAVEETEPRSADDALSHVDALMAELMGDDSISSEYSDSSDLSDMERWIDEFLKDDETDDEI